jgi:hypothetical protein
MHFAWTTRSISCTRGHLRVTSAKYQLFTPDACFTRGRSSIIWKPTTTRVDDSVRSALQQHHPSHGSANTWSVQRGNNFTFPLFDVSCRVYGADIATTTGAGSETSGPSFSNLCGHCSLRCFKVIRRFIFVIWGGAKLMSMKMDHNWSSELCSPACDRSKFP